MLVMELADELMRIERNLYRFAYSKTYNHDAAEDLTMEVITKILESADRITPEIKNNLKPYAIQSIKNAFLNWEKSEKKTISEIDTIGHSIYDETQDDNSEKFPESWDFEKILKNLDAKCQEILILYGLGSEYEEIADVMSLKIGTVKSRMARCRDTLYKKREGHRYG
jgi:RNA polymerase sigma-70 factor (ECF subfamily)